MRQVRECAMGTSSSGSAKTAHFVIKFEPRGQREPVGLICGPSLALSANGEASLDTLNARDRWSEARGPYF